MYCYLYTAEVVGFEGVYHGIIFFPCALFLFASLYYYEDN